MKVLTLWCKAIIMRSCLFDLKCECNVVEWIERNKTIWLILATNYTKYRCRRGIILYRITIWKVVNCESVIHLRKLVQTAIEVFVSQRKYTMSNDWCTWKLHLNLKELHHNSLSEGQFCTSGKEIENPKTAWLLAISSWVDVLGKSKNSFSQRFWISFLAAAWLKSFEHMPTFGPL